jgi:hypothetical protein
MKEPDTELRSKTGRSSAKAAARAYAAAGRGGSPETGDDGTDKGTGHRLFIVILVLVVAASAAVGVVLYQRQHSGRVIERADAVNKEQISVFFPDDQGKLVRKMVDAQRQLSDKARADALLRELKEARCVPDRLKIYELAVGNDGVLYLNLSGEFIDRNTPEREITMTYSIVNSFIESFRGAKSVQILVEGQPVYTRSGVLYILEPLHFNRELLEE